MSTTAIFGRRLALLQYLPSTSIRQIGGGKGRKKPRRLWRLVKWTAGGAALTTGGYYGWKYVKKLTRPSFEGQEKKKLVILGSGWGALSVINHLEPGQFDVTVVSPRNYFLFSPLLPSVTVGTVESRSIVEPIRKLIKRHHKSDEVTFLEAECVDIELEKKQIWCEDRSGIVGAVSRVGVDYDLLVVAVGATNNTFKTPGVEQHCHFLKEIDDAQSIRNVIIDLVETASIPGQTEEERRRLLHFVIVGGGPTGVEFAAEVRDFLREDVAKIYPGIEKDTRVTLVQSQDHVLNTYDQQISSYTEERFKMDGINLITNSRCVWMTEVIHPVSIRIIYTSAIIIITVVGHVKFFSAVHVRVIIHCTLW